MVPLRREDFDTAGKLVSDELFTQVRFGPLTGAPDRRGGRGPALASSPASAWVARLARHAGRLAGRRAGRCRAPCLAA